MSPMNDVTDQIETDVRERILTTAERLFREIGYQKTTVADIARELRMSPANVYRFFDSKKSINAGVAKRLMGEVEQASRKIASGKTGATERLRQLLTTIHRMNSDRYVADAKMHDMVAFAMEEDWDVCRMHMETIIGDDRDRHRRRRRLRRIPRRRRARGGQLRLRRDGPVLSPAADRGLCRQARAHPRSDDRFRHRRAEPLMVGAG